MPDDRPTLSVLAVRLLRERIASGQLPPGSRLSDLALAKEIGISRTPIREAILRLEEMGLIERKAYRGSIVAGIDLSRLEEVTALRIELEGLATELGVPNLSDEDLSRMGEILNQTELYTQEPEFSFARFNELNREFHGIIYRATSGPSLLRLIEGLGTEADRIRLHFSVKNELAGEYHRRILEACRNRDAYEAATFTRAHLLEAYFFMRGTREIPPGILQHVVERTGTSTPLV